MSRNIKALGLALFAAFAFSAFAAQGASAAAEEHEFESPEHETTVLTGHQESGEDAHTFTINETVLTCHIATFSGTQSGEVVDHVSMFPTYDECHSNVNTSTGSAIVHSNGCTYTFDSDTVETGSEETHAAVSLTCPEGNEITITSTGCTIHVPPFEEKYGVTYTNIEKDGAEEKSAVTVTATVSGITSTTTGGLSCLAAGLGFEEKTWESVYEGKTIVTGYIDSGLHSEWTESHKVTEGAQIDIQLGGTP